MLYFTGFKVVEPFLVYAPARRDGHERAAELNRYRARVLDISSVPPIAYPRLGEYDEQYVLRTASSSKRAG